MRILTRRLQAASPAGVPDQIPHGRKGHLRPGRRAFPRGRLTQAAQKLRLKGTAQGQRNGIHRPKAVDDVRHEHQRDLRAASFQVFLLHPSDLPGSHHVQGGAHIPQKLFSDPKLVSDPKLLPLGVQHVSGNLDQLADLFRYRKGGKQLPQLFFLHKNPRSGAR